MVTLKVATFACPLSPAINLCVFCCATIAAWLWWQSQVKALLSEWSEDAYPNIIKPVQSAGSDDVFKCGTLEESLAAFETIAGTVTDSGDSLLNFCARVQQPCGL